jgi:hypothetical protein
MMSHRIYSTLAVMALCAVFTRSASAELIYGIANQAPATALVTFDSANPSALLSGVFLTGLQPNETILGIDFRPATGQLYGLGSTSRLYTINPVTGSTFTFGGPFSTPLNGFSFGFDFNPVIDRIRVVSETNQNLVLDPNTFTVQTVAPNVAYGAADPNFGVDPNVVHSAYTNNVPSPASTTLYGIDTGLDVLVTQVAATGVLSTVGPLGLNAAAAGGFDISGVTGVAYASILPAASSVSSLYSINLATGAATNLGVIDGGLAVTALTTAPVIPEPATAVLALVGFMGCLVARRQAR